MDADPVNLPPLPDGFQLENSANSGMPPLPEGFEHEQPSTQSALPPLPTGFQLEQRSGQEQPEQPPERTWGQEIGREARTFGRGILPAAAAAVGTIAGGALGSAVGPAGTFGGALVGGAGAGIIADQVQNKLADALGLDSEEQRQADAANPNALSTAAGVAPALVGFSPGSLATKLSQRVLTGGIMGGVDVGTQALTKGEVDPAEAAVAAGTGFALPNVRPWAQGAGERLAGSVGAGLARGHGNGTAPQAGRTDGNVNAVVDDEAKVPSTRAEDVPLVSRGVAMENPPAPEAKAQPVGEQTGQGFAAVGSERDYSVGTPRAQEGIQGAPSEPLVTLDPAKGASQDMLDTVAGQQEQVPNEAAKTQAAQGPEPAPPRPEPGPPANEPAPPTGGQAPAEDQDVIPPFLRRAPPEAYKMPAAEPNEGVQQQAQQPQPPAAPQGPDEPDAAFAARIKASQAQAAQNSPGGRQSGAPYNAAEAAKVVEKLNGDTVKGPPPAAQKAIDAADEKIGRVPLRTRNAVEKWLSNTFAGKALNPTGVDESGGYFKKSARENLGQIQDRYDRFNHAFNQPVRDIFNNLTPEQGHEIQRALQDPNPMERLAKWPELEPVVRELRNQIKADADFKVQKGSLDAEQLERDHFPQLWKSTKDADAFLDNWYARQGSKAGFKAKVHPTIADGEAAGLQLKYTNPMDPVTARMKSDYRYQMLNSMLQDALRDHIVSNTKRPGDIELNAKINGMNDRKLYAQEGYATAFNNHYSPGWRDTPAGRQFMDVAQPATAWGRSLLLGLSPFHGVTMLNEAMISQIKLGLQTMARDPAEGAKILAMSPIGGKTLYGAGKGAQKAVLAQTIDLESPYAQTIPLLRKANARFFGDQGSTLDFNPGENVKPLAPAPAETIMQSFSNAFKEAKSDITTDFKDAKGNPIQLSKATLKAVGTAMQAVSHPLFGQVIPAMKAGAAHMELGEWLRQHPDTPPEEQHDMAMRIWDDVENRFGMMTHDNLFWNNKIKEGMQIGMTSPTWTTGFIKNFAGGLSRGAMHPSRALMGSKDYDPNISSALTLGLTVALTSGIYQYLKTGKPPGSIYDLMAGQTGGKTNAGQPERAILPGFQKDVYGWFHDPVNEAYNKLGPVPKTAIETAINKGWAQTPKGARYGPISNPNDPFWKQVYDRAAHVARSIEPISAQQLSKTATPGSNISTAERAAAIKEAPKYINPGGNPKERKAVDREYKATHLGQ